MGDFGDTRQDLSSTVAARRELGPEYDDALVEGFVSRIERAIDERVDRSLHRHPGGGRTVTLRSTRGAPRRRFLPLGSIALGIPITAVAGSNFHGIDGVIVAIVAWAGIVAVNAAHAFGAGRQQSR